MTASEDRLPRLVLGGAEVELAADTDQAVALIMSHATDADGPALGVVSANLDHLYHFGRGSEGEQVMRASSPGPPERSRSARELAWLTLLDGAPLVQQARRLTGQSWPRLAGSDLIDPLLDVAEDRGVTVGFLGGRPETHEALRLVLTERRPRLDVRGWWAPHREQLTDPVAAGRLADEVRSAGVQMLVVGLGKPRQERWIAEYGGQSGANVLLAFGAVVDFLAGGVRRAPARVSDAGLEWAWRLAMEPRRLARRYLIQGPPSYLALRRHSRATPTEAPGPLPSPAPRSEGRFARAGEPAEVCAIAVTYNNADDVESLITDLRRETADLAIRLVVVDNASSDGTADLVAAYDDVELVRAPNAGYAAGINRGRAHLGSAGAMLVLNPDLRVEPGAILAMYRRLDQPDVGAVVPRIVGADGEVYESLRREPSISRTVGDAALGRRLGHRPGWSSEIVHDRSQYVDPHRVDWATGAALMVRADLDRRVGDWDERFFLYSEETDYFRRLRATGAEVWYEPAATVVHAGGGSGTSPRQAALMSINKVRYAELHHGRAYATTFRVASGAADLLRLHQESHRLSLAALVSRRRADAILRSFVDPALATTTEFVTDLRDQGSIIIPAHNEASVIARTLAPLASPAAAGVFEVVVVSNGSSDATAEVACGFPGVHVIELEQGSKPAALNRGDAEATHWPRLYLDADIVIDPGAVLDVFAELRGDAAVVARPPASYATQESAGPVRRYYRARSRVAALNSRVWGAGVYGLGRAGHDRLGSFPDLTADDLWVDSLFAQDEIRIVDTTPVTVAAPRDTASLLTVLSRVYRGNRQVAAGAGPSAAPTSTRQTAVQLLRSVRGPRSLLDAVTYAVLVVRGRRRSARSTSAWERDDSNRLPSGEPTGTLDHVLLTRFNLPSAGVESLIRAKEGWLRDRVVLFDTYCVPSVQAQSDQDFSWIVYLDPQSPSWLLEHMRAYEDDGTLHVVLRESVSTAELLTDVRGRLGATGTHLLTTNLDNDDGLAVDFVARLHAVPLPDGPRAVYLTHGLIRSPGGLYARQDRHNAFCSVLEPWTDPRTCWSNWHNLLPKDMPVVELGGAPAWLQVIHGSNVSNRVRGRLVRADRYRALFGSGLDGVSDPRPAQVARDLLVERPRRFVRESGRAAAKGAVMTVLGKDNLDRLKLALASRRG